MTPRRSLQAKAASRRKGTRMAKKPVEELVEQIKTLDREELAELVSAIENEFSVSAGLGGYAAPPKDPVLIDPSFEIILNKCGPDKGAVVKYIRGIAGGGLLEIKQRIDNLPQVVYRMYGFITFEEAESRARSIIAHLEALGAEADWTFDYGNYLD